MDAPADAAHISYNLSRVLGALGTRVVVLERQDLVASYVSLEAARAAPDARTVSRRWIFETPLDGRFRHEPDWVVVDIGGALKGNEFWTAVEEV